MNICSVSYIIFFIVTVSSPHDSDYIDIIDYQDSPADAKPIDKTNDITTTNDNYIVSKGSRKSVNVVVENSYMQQAPEMIYRYTKHRIPGYDYDELNLIDTNNKQRCDERSFWTYCLCQFTCSYSNQVDCYTPCKSGCECKEHYVFDENIQECVDPKYCPFFL